MTKDEKNIDPVHSGISDFFIAFKGMESLYLHAYVFSICY